MSCCDYCTEEFSQEDCENHSAECDYKAVECANECGAVLYRRNIAQHMLNDCIKRIVICSYCNTDFVANIIAKHYKVCPKMTVLCPHKCDNPVMRREELDDHFANSCTVLIINCEFEEAKCPYKGSRLDLEEHMKDSVSYHLQLMCTLVAEQKEELTLLERKLTISQEGIKLIVKKLMHLDEKWIHTQRQLVVQRLEIEKLQSEKNRVFMWAIHDWAEACNSAKLGVKEFITSNSFTTSRYGYKIQVVLYPDGDEDAEGTHISLFIQIMPGNHDSVLDWPFKHKVTFTLLDQTSNDEDVSNLTATITPDPTLKSYQRPEGVPNLAIGFSQFVEHHTINEGMYIKDDTIFIKVEVEL